MWMLQLLGLSLVMGTVVGVSWRVIEDWMEKRASQKMAHQTEESATSTVKSE